MSGALTGTERVLMEHEGRLNRLVIEADVLLVDLAAARAVVDLGDGAKSAPLPWLALRAGRDRSWIAPSVGEQVLVLTDGTPANGVIIGSIYQSAHPAPSDKDTTRSLIFDDGTAFSYDGATGEMSITLGAGAKKLSISGDVQVTGNIAATGDVSDAKDSMAAMRTAYGTHTHVAPAGMAGGPTTGPTPSTL